jgi:hypothetical protein
MRFGQYWDSGTFLPLSFFPGCQEEGSNPPCTLTMMYFFTSDPKQWDQVTMGENL